MTIEWLPTMKWRFGLSMAEDGCFVYFGRWCLIMWKSGCL